MGSALWKGVPESWKACHYESDIVYVRNPHIVSSHGFTGKTTEVSYFEKISNLDDEIAFSPEQYRAIRPSEVNVTNRYHRQFTMVDGVVGVYHVPTSFKACYKQRLNDAANRCGYACLAFGALSISGICAYAAGYLVGGLAWIGIPAIVTLGGLSFFSLGRAGEFDYHAIQWDRLHGTTLQSIKTSRQRLQQTHKTPRYQLIYANGWAGGSVATQVVTPREAFEVWQADVDQVKNRLETLKKASDEKSSAHFLSEKTQMVADHAISTPYKRKYIDYFQVSKYFKPRGSGGSMADVRQANQNNENCHISEPTLDQKVNQTEQWVADVTMLTREYQRNMELLKQAEVGLTSGIDANARANHLVFDSAWGFAHAIAPTPPSRTEQILSSQVHSIASTAIEQFRSQEQINVVKQSARREMEIKHEYLSQLNQRFPRLCELYLS